jgi:hypothetical protein
MTNELMTVPFHGNNLFITTVNGQPYTPMKPIVEGMGLDWRSQATKFRSNKDRWGVVMITTPTGGDYQESTCLPLRKLTGWLMTIQPSRVAPEIRPKIITYQNECDDALWDYWTKGQATRHGAFSQADDSRHPSIKDYLLLNERMNQLPGAQPTVIMDATLTMIQENTGIKVDALRQVITPLHKQGAETQKSKNSDATIVEVKPIGSFEAMSNQYCPEFTSKVLEEFEGNKIRLFKTTLGELWFSGFDVCTAMGYSDPHRALSKHVPDSEKRRIPIETASGKQVMIVANELGVHSLVMSSLKDGAIRFRDWLHDKIPNTPKVLHAELALLSDSENASIPSKSSRELKTDGGISANDIESWKLFCSQPMHTRLLQLHWISRNRNELAVLWSFCEHNRRTATLGEKYHRRDSSRLITSKLGDRIDCNQVGVSRAINLLLEEDVLCKKAHVDNVIRKLWLNWPALAKRLEIYFPDKQILRLNWLADNRTELCVLSMLAKQSIENSCARDGTRSTPFIKVTLKTIQLHSDQFGVSANAKSIERAVAKLSEAGLIELSDKGVMNKARISTTCLSSITTFLTTNFENELW